MSRLRLFLSGMLTGILSVALLLALTVRFFPYLLIVNHPPAPADAVVALGGDHDGSRLRRSLQLLDGGFAPQIILTGDKQHWEHVLRKRCISCSLEGRNAIFLEESEDTRTDAQLTLQYCRDNNFKKILVVTSPYHSRRTELVFDDIFDGSRIEPLIISSEKFGRLLPPTDRWWTDRATIEIAWLEFGKILYWELTPFMEFRGEGKKLMLGERGR